MRHVQQPLYVFERLIGIRLWGLMIEALIWGRQGRGTRYMEERTVPETTIQWYLGRSIITREK
jgi:hypothetical protein